MNSFGTLIRLATFGESHGPAMGGILDGMPPLVHIDMAGIQTELKRRRPGNSFLTSQRKEPDEVEILSGINSDGITLGSPIGFIIRNHDARSSDYADYADIYRPNHADFTYQKKYGIREAAGGGRSSARETVSWVVAGALCRQWLDKFGISIRATFIETNSVEDVAKRKDSTGGIVACRVKGMPWGIGEPVFDKLHARLAAAMMTINAAKGFEYGDGFKSAYMTGSESADIFNPFSDSDNSASNKMSVCASNHSGGIQGGISNGMPIEFKVYFKPTPTIGLEQPTVNSAGQPAVTKPAGRHDPCVAIRAVPVVEAMTALVLADMLRLALSYPDYAIKDFTSI